MQEITAVLYGNLYLLPQNNLRDLEFCICSNSNWLRHLFLSGSSIFKYLTHNTEQLRKMWSNSSTERFSRVTYTNNTENATKINEAENRTPSYQKYLVISSLVNFLFLLAMSTNKSSRLNYFIAIWRLIKLQIENFLKVVSPFKWQLSTSTL